MPRQLNDAQRAELHLLYREGQITLDYLERLGIGAARFRPSLDEAVADQDLAGMRMMARDFRGWLRDLSPRQRRELIAELRKQIGVDLGKEREKDLRQIAAVVKRGRIRSRAEYELVLDRVEEIHTDAAAQAEVEQLNGLLAAAHAE